MCLTRARIVYCETLNGVELDGRNDVDRAGETEKELQCWLELADRGNQNVSQARDGEGKELVLIISAGGFSAHVSEA